MDSTAKKQNGKRKVKKVKRRKPETGQVRILSVLTSNLIPSPENDRLYRPVDPSDPEMKKLAKSVKVNGVLEPLTVTLDNYIVSGHRRHCAAGIAGIERVPVQFVNFNRSDDPDRYMVLLREFNHLLNDPPLVHASKPNSQYKNNRNDYSNMDDLLVRARLDGTIPMEAIEDETRPVTIWSCHKDVRSFIRKELNGMFKGYWRDLQQSQPNHIEILCEKNTVHPILRSVAMKYCIPITSGRGFCSLPPRHAMAERFAASGGEKLILLIVSDFDPAGESIAESYARSMRDDFYIDNIHPIKVALTKQQAIDRGVSLEMPPKKRSPKYKPFVKEHGHGTAELEALAPGDLQDILTDAVDSVMDIDAFNEELAREEEDSHFLEGVRRQAKGAFEGINFDD